jgi:hypothetical protein
VDDGRSMHLYIVVNCKTRGCRSVHVLMHLGEEGKTPPKVEYWMSYPLLVDCPNCGKTYDYSDAEEQFRQKELPPPAASRARVSASWIPFVRKWTVVPPFMVKEPRAWFVRMKTGV